MTGALGGKRDVCAKPRWSNWAGIPWASPTGSTVYVERPHLFTYYEAHRTEAEEFVCASSALPEYEADLLRRVFSCGSSTTREVETKPKS
jgi:hypothetical protein